MQLDSLCKLGRTPRQCCMAGQSYFWFTRRHRSFLARLGEKTRLPQKRLTAAETEDLIGSRAAQKAGLRKRGAPVTRVQFSTPLANIVLTFRRQSPTTEEILAALDAAKVQAKEHAKSLNIIRAK